VWRGGGGGVRREGGDKLYLSDQNLALSDFLQQLILFACILMVHRNREIRVTGRAAARGVGKR